MNIEAYRGEIRDLIAEVGKTRANNPEQALTDCDKLLEYGEKNRDDGLIGYAHFSKGEIYYLINDIPMFYLEILKSMKHFEQIREWGYLGASHIFLGVIAISRGNAPLALDNFYKALELSRAYMMPELRCRVDANIGYLYLIAGMPVEAEKHLSESYKYTTNHMTMENYVGTLNTILLGRGKVALKENKMEEAIAIFSEINQKCIPLITDSEKFSVGCFEAQLLSSNEQKEACTAKLHQLAESFSSSFPVLDVFEDVHEILELMLSYEEYDDFLLLHKKLEEPVATTMIKNLQKRLIHLKLTYFKQNEMQDDYKELSGKYLEIVDQMEPESELMVSSMLSLRNEIHRLREERFQEKKKASLLERQSKTDPLTGLANRLKLNEYAEVAFERALTNTASFGIELLDVDYFKEYNDNYGHQRGDECLLFIAGKIQKLAKSHIGVSCYRYGGDEFVIVYENFKEQEVFDLAKELKNSILEGNLEHKYSKGEVKSVTISQGLYWGVPVDGESVWEYLSEADAQLYKVKQKSRNSIMLSRSKAGEDKETKDRILIKPIISELEEEEFEAG